MGRLRPEQPVGSVVSEVRWGTPGGPADLPRRRDGPAGLSFPVKLAAQKSAFVEVPGRNPGGGAPTGPAASGRFQAEGVQGLAGLQGPSQRARACWRGQWGACWRGTARGGGPAASASTRLWITRTRHGRKVPWAVDQDTEGRVRGDGRLPGWSGRSEVRGWRLGTQRVRQSSGRSLLRGEDSLSSRSDRSVSCVDYRSQGRS